METVNCVRKTEEECDQMEATWMHNRGLILESREEAERKPSRSHGKESVAVNVLLLLLLLLCTAGCWGPELNLMELQDA